MKYCCCFLACFIHLLLHGQQLTGDWKGTLPQDDKTYTFTMQAQIVQSGNQLSGTCRYENPYQQWVILKFSGSITGNVVTLNETAVVNCTNGLNWCIKQLKGYVSKDPATGNYTIEGNWTSRTIYNGIRYYRGYCAPGNFRISLYAPPAPPQVAPERSVTVSGQLLDAATLRPVEASVTVAGSKTAKQLIHTDGAGHYTFQALPDETCHILLTADGYIPQRETIQTSRTSLTRNFLLTPLQKPPANNPALRQSPAADPVAVQKFLNRELEIADIITINSDSVRLYFYDNGEVDNDTITVYYNKVKLLDKKRLTEKPLVVTVVVKPGDFSELVMFADNLGDIPPNTALLIFYDGPVRKEVTIRADTRKSGVIIFKRKLPAN